MNLIEVTNYINATRNNPARVIRVCGPKALWKPETHVIGDANFQKLIDAFEKDTRDVVFQLSTDWHVVGGCKAWGIMDTNYRVLKLIYNIAEGWTIEVYFGDCKPTD
jgi:hypothetical protein